MEPTLHRSLKMVQFQKNRRNISNFANRLELDHLKAAAQHKGSGGRCECAGWRPSRSEARILPAELKHFGSAKGWSRSRSLHGIGDAGLAAHAQERCRYSRSTCSAFFFFRVPTLFLAGRFSFLRTHARTHAPARTTDDERRDVRSAGVADWNTALGGNTERTLTAAAAPSPRDPYRHAPTMRPPRKKVRPFSFLNYLKTASIFLGLYMIGPV